MASKDSKIPNRDRTQILRAAVIGLSITSFFTTAQGMQRYVFQNAPISLASSAAIQGILLALSMNLPTYLKNLLWTIDKDGKEEKRHGVGKWVLFGGVILFTLVALSCSSFFSFIYIADVIHQNSWSMDSQLLVQRTYRSELYDAADYAQAYRTYLEEGMGEMIVRLDEQAEGLNDTLPPVVSINLDEDTEVYSPPHPASSNMLTVIHYMKLSVPSSPTQAPTQKILDQTVQAIESAQIAIGKNIDSLSSEIDRCNDQIDSNIQAINKNMDTIRQIQRTTPNADVSGLNNNNISLQNLIESLTEKRTQFEDQVEQLKNAIQSLDNYSVQLGLTNSSTSISIRRSLLELQTEFFKPDPDEEKLLNQATTVFEQMRSNSTLSANSVDGTSYTTLLIDMNRLLQSLKNYNSLKETESELETLIHNLRDDSVSQTEPSLPAPTTLPTSTPENPPALAKEETTEPSPSPDIADADNVEEPLPLPSPSPEGDGNDLESNNNEQNNNSNESDEDWKPLWRERLENLKAYIGSMPLYIPSSSSDTLSDNTLSLAQAEILRTYNRSAACNQLDELTRRYINEHNPLEKGVIYLTSPYWQLAALALIIALFLDIAGFIFGFVDAGTPQTEINENYKDASGVADNSSSTRSRSFRRGSNSKTTPWTILKTQNDYILLTGDYEKKDNKYYYQGFVNGLSETWEGGTDGNSSPFTAGIIQRKEKAPSVVSAQQPLFFAGQREDLPHGQDGIEQNCILSFKDGSLYKTSKDAGEKSQSLVYLASINDYVPIHSYNEARGESRTLPAAQMVDGKNLSAQTALLALNPDGTRIVAIYVMEQI